MEFNYNGILLMRGELIKEREGLLGRLLYRFRPLVRWRLRVLGGQIEALNRIMYRKRL